MNRRDTAEGIVKFGESENYYLSSRGVIVATYVLILLLGTDSKLDYFNRKQGYSVNTQTVIGYNLECPSVATGYPNSMCDTRILRNTCLFQRTKN